MHRVTYAQEVIAPGLLSLGKAGEDVPCRRMVLDTFNKTLAFAPILAALQAGSELPPWL